MPNKVKSTPTIEVYARPLGSLQFVCPGCGHLNVSRISWRKARVRCNHCGWKFRIGLGFAAMVTALPPYNARFMGTWNGFTSNCLFDRAMGRPAVGRVTGSVEWNCPSCTTAQTSGLDWETGSVRCVDCQHIYYLALLLYRSAKSYPAVLPIDWTPLRGSFLNAKKSDTPHDAVSPAAAGAGA